MKNKKHLILRASTVLMCSGVILGAIGGGITIGMEQNKTMHMNEIAHIYANHNKEKEKLEKSHRGDINRIFECSHIITYYSHEEKESCKNFLAKIKK